MSGILSEEEIRDLVGHVSNPHERERVICKAQAEKSKKAERERIFADLERLGGLAHHIDGHSGYIDASDYYTLVIGSDHWKALKGGS